jgi:hypothetical protein
VTYRDRSMEIEKRETITEVMRFISYEYRKRNDVIAYAFDKMSQHRAMMFWHKLANQSVWRSACEFLPDAQRIELEVKYQPGMLRTVE